MFFFFFFSLHSLWAAACAPAFDSFSASDHGAVRRTRWSFLEFYAESSLPFRCLWHTGIMCLRLCMCTRNVCVFSLLVVTFCCMFAYNSTRQQGERHTIWDMRYPTHTDGTRWMDIQCVTLCVYAHAIDRMRFGITIILLLNPFYADAELPGKFMTYVYCVSVWVFCSAN